MEQASIDRINQLARLAKERDLTPEELTERTALRTAYIAAVKGSLNAHLDNTYYMDEKGVKRKLGLREKG